MAESAFIKGMALGQSAYNAQLDVKMQQVRDQRLREALAMEQRVLEEKNKNKVESMMALARISKAMEDPNATPETLAKAVAENPNVAADPGTAEMFSGVTKLWSQSRGFVDQAVSNAAQQERASSLIKDVVAYERETGVSLTLEEARKDKQFIKYRQGRIEAEKLAEKTGALIKIGDQLIERLSDPLISEEDAARANESLSAILDQLMTFSQSPDPLSGLTPGDLGGTPAPAPAPAPAPQTPPSPAQPSQPSFLQQRGAVGVLEEGTRQLGTVGSTIIPGSPANRAVSDWLYNKGKSFLFGTGGK